MLIPTTQALCQLQPLLYAPGGLHHDSRSLRRTPDGFSRELHQRHADHMRQALAQRWALQQFLPTEAANDLPSLPGAA